MTNQTPLGSCPAPSSPTLPSESHEEESELEALWPEPPLPALKRWEMHGLQQQDLPVCGPPAAVAAAARERALLPPASPPPLAVGTLVQLRPGFRRRLFVVTAVFLSNGGGSGGAVGRPAYMAIVVPFCRRRMAVIDVWQDAQQQAARQRGGGGGRRVQFQTGVVRRPLCVCALRVSPAELAAHESGAAYARAVAAAAGAMCDRASLCKYVCSALSRKRWHQQRTGDVGARLYDEEEDMGGERDGRFN